VQKHPSTATEQFAWQFQALQKNGHPGRRPADLQDMDLDSGQAAVEEGAAVPDAWRTR